MEKHKHLILSISTAATSIASLINASITKESIAWAVGIVAGLCSIYCSWLTAREKRMNIRELKNKNKKP